MNLISLIFLYEPRQAKRDLRDDDVVSEKSAVKVTSQSAHKL